MSQVRATQVGWTVSPVLTTVLLWSVGSQTLNDTPEQRSGELRLTKHSSQDMLQSWTHGCTLSNNMRQANQNIVRPQYIRSMFPISSVSKHGLLTLVTQSVTQRCFPWNQCRVADEICLAIDAKAQAKAQAEIQPQQF